MTLSDSPLHALYVAHSHRVPGIPPYEALVPEIRDRYLPHLSKPFADGVPWPEFMAEIDRETAHLAAQADPRLPIYNNEERKGWAAFTAPESVRDALTALCTSIAIPHSPAPIVGLVFEVLVDRLARWYALPRTGVEERNAEFVFYRLRCMLAGAGYANWKHLAGLVVSQVGECPYDPNESLEVWTKELETAHKACGWPSTLLWLDWSSVPDFIGEGAGVPDWMKPLALAHIIKHVRRASDHLHMAYRGAVDFCPTGKKPSRPFGSPGFWQTYSRTLGKPASSGGKGMDSSKAAALEWAASTLGVDDLLPAIPISDVPGEILAGPWSTLLPAFVPSVPGFLCPGARLVGVWKAQDGRVVPYEGDEEDCLDIAWNTEDASSPDNLKARSVFAASIPATYPVVAPSTLLKKVFPHLVLPPAGTVDHDGYCALIDAVLCASVMRHGASSRVDLLREFPLIVILPFTPTAEDSTDNGKGMLCQAIAGAFAPGIYPISVPDSSSAPDSRAVAEELRTWGTLALDEFQIPQSKSHVLARDNLQTLCTGGTVAAGRVLENGGKVGLRHSMVINAKWLDLSPDLRNRSIALFLDALPEEQRARVDIKMMLESGQFALMLKLAAVSLVDALKLRELGNKVPPSTTRAWRFTAHRQIAAAVLAPRLAGLHDLEGKAFDPYAIVDAVRLDCDDDLERHQQMADESGLTAATASGSNIRVSWSMFWSGLDDGQASSIAGQIAINGEPVHGEKMVSLSSLFRMRLDVMGKIGGAFYQALPAISGQEIRATNIALVRALGLSARAYYSADHSRKQALWHELPGELGHKWEAIVVPRCWDGGSPSARTLMVGLRMKGQP